MSGAMLFDANGEAVVGPGGMPESRLAFCRADELVIEDTWHVHGLCGSGSTHYRAESVFIPEDQVLRIDESLFEGREPLYASGFNWVTTMAAVPLGTARRAIDEAKNLVADRIGGIPPQPMARLPHVQETIAEAETRYGAARAFLYSAAEAFWDELERGTPAVPTKGRLALANVNCFRMAAEVTRQMFDLIGANVIFEGSPLERLARDALTLNQHMIIARPALASYGAMMLGEPHPSPLY
jgi:alkylation response protein AidB-like acyl-CoA dehydrogenase